VELRRKVEKHVAWAYRYHVKGESLYSIAGDAGKGWTTPKVRDAILSAKRDLLGGEEIPE
jgi:hypothetical protein